MNRPDLILPPPPPPPPPPAVDNHTRPGSRARPPADGRRGRLDDRPRPPDEDRLPRIAGPGPERPAAPPGRTGARLRRAALPLLLCLVSFGAPPAQAYKAGTDADDSLSIPEYADAAAYLADASRDAYYWVKIGQHVFPRWRVEDYHGATPLTDANLVRTYADLAAYLADADRADSLYAKIGGEIYVVTELEALRTANSLAAADDLPDPEWITSDSDATAVGAGARATGYRATAVGHSALALGAQSTVVGQRSRAWGRDAVVLGANTRAFDRDSTALGQYTHAQGTRTTAVGSSAAVRGERSTGVGYAARVAGARNVALGQYAQTVSGDADRDLVSGLDSLIRCAHTPEGTDAGDDDGGSFARDCDQFLTGTEKGNANLRADTAAGRAFRQTVKQRLAGVLDDMSVARATALGQSALAGADYATAVGQYSQATGNRGTAIGSAAVASGDYGTALGRAAFVTGEEGTAAGIYAQVHGDRGVALGKYAGAGGWVTWKRYTNAAAYLADDQRTSGGVLHVVIGGKVYRIEDLEAVSGLTDSNLPSPVGDASQVVTPTEVYVSLADYLADPDRTDHHQVIIAGKVYAVSALEAVAGLTEATLPAAVEGASGAVAVGAGASAPAEDAIAVGPGTEAAGGQAVVLGADAAAFGAQAVAIGPEAVAVGDGGMAVGGRAFSRASIAEYANVAAFLADPNRNGHRYVKIGSWVYPRWQLAEFHSETGLTDANLVKTYADVAAYVADSQRTGASYAAIGGRLYLVSLLEAYRSAGVLADDNLPYALSQNPDTEAIAMGPRASANGYRATAVGARAGAGADETTAVGTRAQAEGRKSTAVGRSASALARNATALGARAFAFSSDSMALGTEARAWGDDALAAGTSAAGYGEDATSLGTRATALGEQTTALGRGAVAASLGAGQTVSDAVPEWAGLGVLIECARQDWYAPDTSGSGQNLLNDCRQYLTAAEKGDADLIRDTAEGRALRRTIRQRLESRLDALSTTRATAVGANARALNEYATALGQFAQAIEAHSTAIGARAIALGQGSIALGSGASATGANGIAIGAGVTAGANEVVIGTADHATYKLPGLAHAGQNPVALTIDSEGRLVVLVPSGAQPPPPRPPRTPTLSRSAGPRIAAPDEPQPENPKGAGDGGGAADGAGSGEEARGDAPEEEAREGEGSASPALHGSNGGTGGAGRAVGGGGALGQPAAAPAGADPATTERLDRLEARFNRSLGVLGDRLDKATAMSSALTALPNVVPNGGRFYVGAGAGSYRGQQAIAIGISARTGSAGNVFFNAGAATTGSGSMSMRAGVGIVW